MSVRTYNPSVRVGNWNEDICLKEVCRDFNSSLAAFGDKSRAWTGYLAQWVLIPSFFQDLLKDFLDKKEKGELLIQKTHSLHKTILNKVR